MSHDLPPEDERALLEELNIHKIELEVQNEELRQTEAMLQRSRNHYFQLFYDAPVAYLVVGAEGRVENLNARAAELLGLAPPQIKDRLLVRFAEASDQIKLQAHLKAVFESGRATPELIRFRRGAVGRLGFRAQVESILQPGLQGEGMTALCSFVSVEARERSREALEQELRSNELLLNLSRETLKGGALESLIKETGEHLLRAEGARCVCVYSLLKDEPRRLLALGDVECPMGICPGPKDLPALAHERALITPLQVEGGAGDRLCTVTVEGDASENGERIAVMIGGEVEARAHAEKLAAAFSSLLTLIQSRQKTRSCLEESESRLQRVLDGMIEGCAIVDAGGRYRYANRAAALLLGERAEGLEGRTVEAVWGEAAASVREAITRCIQTGARAQAELRFLVDDAWRWLTISAHPSEGGALLFVLDMTDERLADERRRDLEQQILQAQKLESLGVMAGGIAHDFNNLLVGILGNADLAKVTLEGLAGEDAEEARACLSDIYSAGQAAAGLCRQMLTFAGRQKPAYQPLQLDALIEETRPLLRAAIPSGVEVHYALEPLEIVGDPSQLRQIVMNLVINAAEAFDTAQGRVDVRLDEVHLASPRLCGQGLRLPPGCYARLRVDDEAGGMDAATLTRIFEPFYSTKFQGRGLGLAALLGIAKAHQGGVEVDSTPGEGSRFTIYLPARPLTLSKGPGPQPPSITPRPRLKLGRVLVADDEPVVLALAERLLRRLGYEAEIVRDGEAALQRVAEDGGRYEFALIDVTMPKASGLEILEAAHARRPPLRVILMSGYTEHSLRSRSGGHRPEAFLAKPFGLRELLESIEEMDGKR
ncbi:PAS domain-containing protein [Myxococcota bacterium]|nr:PAS domain-containing protein [Myxococcota bacterium]